MTIAPLSSVASILLAITAAAAIALVCWRARLLTPSGAASAAGVGALVFVCGGGGGAAALLAFFITSNLLGRFRKAGKAGLAFEKGGQRDAWQVLANGGLAALLIALSCVPQAHGTSVLRLAFLAALAEANADTWATEIGAGFAWPPRLITTLRRARAGESGAVSLPGTLAALAGTALIGAFALRQYGQPGFVAVTFAGFAGALLDSIIGATLQAQYAAPDGSVTERWTPDARLVCGVSGIGNDLVNFAATLSSACLAALLWVALRH